MTQSRESERVRKQAPADLAIFGGAPAFDSHVHVGRPNIGDPEALVGRLRGILESRWLTNDGPVLQEFEHRLGQELGARNCVVVANATLGLMLALKALGIDKGEVILPAFTFIATAHAIAWQGLTPVFSDIDRNSYQIDPEEVVALITPNTKAIVGVHLFGAECDLGALESIARRHGLKLLFDAAHSVGCSPSARPVGSFGDVSVFSLHATKILNSFEGGAITTDDDKLAATLRLMRSFGFSDYDHVDCLGMNAKLTEPAAAMGLISLDALPRFIEANRTNYQAYVSGLSDLPGIRPPPLGERQGSSNCHYVVIEVDQERAGISRDDLLSILRAENILARRYFYPGCHRMKPYDSRAECRPRSLSRTEEAAGRVLVLPTGESVQGDMVGKICDVVRLVAVNGREIKFRMQSPL